MTDEEITKEETKEEYSNPAIEATNKTIAALKAENDRTEKLFRERQEYDSVKALGGNSKVQEEEHR